MDNALLLAPFERQFLHESIMNYVNYDSIIMELVGVYVNDFFLIFHVCGLNLTSSSVYGATEEI